MPRRVATCVRPVGERISLPTYLCFRVDRCVRKARSTAPHPRHRPRLRARRCMNSDRGPSSRSRSPGFGAGGFLRHPPGSTSDSRHLSTKPSSTRMAQPAIQRWLSTSLRPPTWLSQRFSDGSVHVFVHPHGSTSGEGPVQGLVPIAQPVVQGLDSVQAFVIRRLAVRVETCEFSAPDVPNPARSRGRGSINNSIDERGQRLDASQWRKPADAAICSSLK